MLYKKEGCIIDGARGFDGVRQRLADLVEEVDAASAEIAERNAEVVRSLRGEAPDDLSDMDDAVEILSECCAEGLYVDFLDGDVVVLRYDDADGPL